MNACDDVLAAMAGYAECSLEGGLARIRTHCLYPSFDPVYVTIDRTATGTYLVSDGGAAYACAWDFGRDHKTIESSLAQAASRFDVGMQGASVAISVEGREWLETAILAVANAAASGAAEAVRRVRVANEAELRERIGEALDRQLRTDLEVAHDFDVSGHSGKTHRFDFAVQDKHHGHLLLMDAVVPHHSSISHRFVAFSDTKAIADRRISSFAIFDRPLARDDAALIRQVADLVPIEALVRGTERVLPRDLTIS